MLLNIPLDQRINGKEKRKYFEPNVIENISNFI